MKVATGLRAISLPAPAGTGGDAGEKARPILSDSVIPARAAFHLGKGHGGAAYASS